MPSGYERFCYHLVTKPFLFSALPIRFILHIKRTINSKNNSRQAIDLQYYTLKIMALRAFLWKHEDPDLNS